MGDSITKFEMDNNRLTIKPHDKIEKLVVNYPENINLSGTIKEVFSKIDKKEGIKLSPEKAPVGKLFKQFPLAFEALAFRSKYGHEKYKEVDIDWMNWKRVPNAISEYEDAAGRHLLKLGNEETELEHLIAEVWNKMAVIQLTLEEINK
mgnify:CR=1 FL=1